MVATHYTNKNLTRSETQIHKSAATHSPNFSTVHCGTVHHGIVPPMTDTICVETEKVEVLIIKGVVIHDVIDVAETIDFYLNREWYDWGSVDPFRGLPHENPRDLIKELEDLASVSKENEVSVDHIICKIFPYCLSGDAFSWFSQLQPRFLTCWEDIKTAFLNKFLYEAAATRQRKFDDMLDKMIKDQEKELMSRFSQMLDSTLKSIDISSCDPTSDGDREITMENFLEFEEFLELEDGEKLGDLDSKEAVGFHKEVKRIHDPVRIVVPCAVFEVEFPIPPDKGAHLSSYIKVLDNHQHVEASQRRLGFKDEVDKGPAEATSIDTDRIASNDTNKPESIDTFTSTSIDTFTSTWIDTHRVSEQKEYEVCRNLFDGGTITQSEKSGGNKRRNWKKRKMTTGIRSYH
ncbi:hypothetical protein DY000_02021634 [Brassica cretica]|uniref:Retrotransposon gag domain-containing protein n=1 Tax=Brassica cretica TaxID=69181 RepID=A0ABQ7E692_BRACR|nr:hypothetical protein DY000_02021634 [Brassica cretica]